MCGKPNEQLSPKRWPLSYLNLTKIISRHIEGENSIETDTKAGKHREPNQKYRIGTVSNIKYYLEVLMSIGYPYLALTSEMNQNI